MGGADLREYIRQQLAVGFSAQQIRSYLLQYGYSAHEVDAAFSPLRPSGSAQRQPNPQLVTYMRQYLSQGYDLNSITDSLRQYGYPADEIGLAADAIYGHRIHHTLDISPRTILTLLVIIVAVGAVAGGTFFLLRTPQPDQLLDYEIRIDKQEMDPGGTLYFTNTFSNLGVNTKVDITVQYRIISIGEATVIYESAETIGLDDTKSSAKSISLPATAEGGRYRLEGTASYRKQRATAYGTFTIIAPKASCRDHIRNQDEDGIDCGGVCAPCEITPSCSDRIQNQDETGIDCGGSCRQCKVAATCIDKIKNQDETGIDCGGACKACGTGQIKPDNQQILAKVRTMGNYSESESLRLCNTIDDDRLRDDCFLELAHIYYRHTYCDQISAQSKTNTCYMFFVQNGDYSVCDKLTEVHTKRICDSLRQISIIISKQNQTTQNLTIS